MLSFGACLALFRWNAVITFYSLPSRAWEFGLGALVALSPRVERAGGVVTEIVAGVALAGLVGICVVLGDTAAHPGMVTLIPTLCTVALIATGGSQEETSVSRLLATAPMRVIGRLSYSWYLWHWPLLVWLRERVRDPSLGASLLVAAGALLPAAITYRWIESPIRFSRRLQTMPRRVIAGALGVAAVTFVAAQLAEMSANHVLAEPRMQPIAAAVRTLPLVFTNGCNLSLRETVAGPCAFGPGTNDTTIVLLGDSHAAQWFPALAKIADARGWRLVSWTKAACPAATVTVMSREAGRPYTECDTWRESTLERIASLHPTLVVIENFGQRYTFVRDGQPADAGTSAADVWRSALVKTARRIVTAGARPLILEDSPFPGFSVPDCLSMHVDKASQCDFDESASRAASIDGVEAHVPDTVAGSAFIRTTDLFCERGRCASERDGVVTFMDDHHISVRFAELLAPELSRRITAALR